MPSWSRWKPRDRPISRSMKSQDPAVWTMSLDRFAIRSSLVMEVGFCQVFQLRMISLVFLKLMFVLLDFDQLTSCWMMSGILLGWFFLRISDAVVSSMNLCTRHSSLNRRSRWRKWVVQARCLGAFRHSIGAKSKRCYQFSLAVDVCPGMRISTWWCMPEHPTWSAWWLRWNGRHGQMPWRSRRTLHESKTQNPGQHSNYGVCRRVHVW